MLAARTSFSFTRLNDESRHREYNAWHQLQHRPENLALPGIAYGERWVHTPRCEEIDLAAAESFRGFHYLNAYWFQEPFATAFAEWQHLAERQFQLGQRLDVHLGVRPYIGLFLPIETHVSPRLSLLPEALCFRPARGVFVRFCEIIEPKSSAAERLFARQDDLLGELVAMPGVAGASLFASDTLALDAASPGLPATESGRFRLSLVHLDADPVDTAPAVLSVWSQSSASNANLERIMFAGFLETIIPWQWDWFEKVGAASSASHDTEIR